MSEQLLDQPKFTKEDPQQLVEFLNFVANHAEFNKLSVKQLLSFAKMLNWAQTKLLPKVEAGIFEIISVKEAAPKKAKK